MIKRYIEYSDLIEKKLTELLDFECENDVTRAMKYSVFAGGKRIRPLLCLEFCYLCGGDVKTALDFACAVEMIHTYSLIHDDLPCMDNDDLRRGKPSCHIQFGEATALLAGDALLTLAFETIANSNNNKHNSCLAALKLSQCAGYAGMIGGQILDLENECKVVELDTIKMTDYLKTSKMIEAACVLGCIAADSDDEKMSYAAKYAENMGIAFQIIDDILDVTSSSQQLGKPIGSDENNNKSTYVSLLGLEASEKMASDFTENALNSLLAFGAKSDELKDFTKQLLNRKS